MKYAEILNGICTNIIEFEGNYQKAIEFNENLVEVVGDYGIGDEYVEGAWQHHIMTSGERAIEIKTELQNLDSTINRATEDLYVLTNTTPYEKVAEVIQQKEELRQELQTLQGV